MATADVRQELDCAICLSLYIDPVTLRCGHNFCRVCINRVLDSQGQYGFYTCPECRANYKKRPALIRSIALCNIVQTFMSSQTDQEETGVVCTYCIHSPVPAAKSCLHCEASLCNNHLRVHSKSPEHVLCDPTTSLRNRRCSVHNKIREFYCTEDTTSICVSCSLAKEHQGHLVETLQEASAKKKEKLRNVLQNLSTKREAMEKRVQDLPEGERKHQEEAASVTERVSTLFAVFRKQLEELEKRINTEITRQDKHYSHTVSNLIRKLEIKKDKLSSKMHKIEKLLNMSDPVTVLEEPEPADLFETEELSDSCDSEDISDHEDWCGTEYVFIKSHKLVDIDVSLISRKIKKGLSDMIAGINMGIYLQEATDILLDVNTAANDIHISSEGKCVSKLNTRQKHPETAERFERCQVLSLGGVSSGRHSWDVYVAESVCWKIGMCYPSIDRKGDQSVIGDNRKSWGLICSNSCLCMCDVNYSAVHDNKRISVSRKVPYQNVRIYLDYEAGQLSFFALRDPIRHLHTFNTTFTEPLHTVFQVLHGFIKIVERNDLSIDLQSA